MGFLSKLFGSRGNQSPARGRPSKPTFYVFGLQGPGFGQAQGEYGPAADMELKLIRPSQWSGRLNVSTPMNGLIQTTIAIEDHLPAIRTYLSKNGVKAEAIDKAIAIAKDEQLILNNPFSGVVVIGIPVE